MMDDTAKIFEEIKKLLADQHFGVLATQGSGYPYCTLVGYAVSDDAKMLLFATIRDTRKYRNLKLSPKISILIDSQTNKFNDFQDAQALTILGVAEDICEVEYDDCRALYLKKHPYFEEFVSMPNCALIKVEVWKYILVNNFQNVLEYIVP